MKNKHTWTEKDEARWQAAEAIEQAFEAHDNEVVPEGKSGTVEEFFDDTVVDWTEKDERKYLEMLNEESNASE